jgi:aspartate ammonia-lyase
MRTRKEIDSLGERELPEETYYGIQTLRAIENFPVSGIRAPTDFIRAYVFVKKAAALANMEIGWLDREVGKAIVVACDEILGGKFLEQFVVDVFQAGAGTSFNMNVNEILANRALEIIGKEKGDYKSIHPNDHVNMGQSSNDTFPTALHIAISISLKPLQKELENLSNAFDKLGREYHTAIKSGRTHLQDALPVTLGQEFGAYAATLRSATCQLKEREQHLHNVALGGTATGTGANAHPQFAEIAISKLRKMTGLPLKPAKNRFEALQSCRPAQAVSSAVKELALELIRIANDLRLLSSGPTTGLAEISLPPVQPGSSIMPGKVNPVMAECLNMIAFQIVGNDLAVSLAVQAGQLELNVMTPVIMHNILSSIKLLTNYLPIFRTKCVEGIQADRKRCKLYLERNPSLATFLTPHLGYLKASKIAQQALHEKRPIQEIIKEEQLLTPEEMERIFNTKFLLGQHTRKRRFKASSKRRR